MTEGRAPSTQCGFTLLEIIVAIIVVAVVAGMLVNYFGTALVRSEQPVVDARDLAQLNQVMENITADYKLLSATNPSPLNTFAGRIGTAGTTQDNVYGQYQVGVNQRISFTSTNPANEQTDANGNILKVKIIYKGHSLTALFAE